MMRVVLRLDAYTGKFLMYKMRDPLSHEQARSAAPGGLPLEASTRSPAADLVEPAASPVKTSGSCHTSMSKEGRSDSLDEILGEIDSTLEAAPSEASALSSTLSDVSLTELLKGVGISPPGAGGVSTTADLASLLSKTDDDFADIFGDSSSLLPTASKAQPEQQAAQEGGAATGATADGANGGAATGAVKDKNWQALGKWWDMKG